SGQKGLCVMDIGNIRSDTFVPPIYLKEVINNKLAGLQKSLYASDENNFVFRVEGLSFRDTGGLRYKYRLCGFDSTWSESASGEIGFNNLTSGQYVFEVFAVNADDVRSKIPIVYTFVIDTPFWKEVWFIIIVLVVFSGIIFSVIRWRIRIIRKEEEKKTAFNKTLSQYQMKALQAQMNPHFIFNAVNSIQNYILEKNTQLAYDYLAKFARLIRLVLNNAKEDSITLEQEVEMLGTYIELEQMRFENKFEFELIIPDEVDTFEVCLPPMLIQPYVENGIWHGLMPLKKDRKGKLRIEIQLAEKQLKISVEDNGIGRAASMNMRKMGKNKSLGMEITQERIDILNSLPEHTGAKVDIIDLECEGKAFGTRVEITLIL
ncbi:MAG TPA: histidine kinase, partial [Nitrosopumilaceae archaeon]|nr:histidine kinase [Nitrosopumilaceae archaeon]